MNNEIILIRRIGLTADACTATGGDMRRCTLTQDLVLLCYIRMVSGFSGDNGCVDDM